MSDKLQVYYYCLSAPSRAVRVFVETNNIPHDLHTVSVVAGETHSPDYLKINPVGTVPFIQDADFGLVDSGAIMAYLSDRFDVPDHWYPKDIKARAKVNAVLLWHGSTLRLGSGNLMNYRVLYPLLGGKPRQEDIVTGFLLPALQSALKNINDVYLKDTDFVAGNEISIADLLLSFEIEQNRFQDASGHNPSFAQLLEPYPKVRAWLERVSAQTGPHYEHALKSVKVFTEELVRKASDPEYQIDLPKVEAASV